MNSTITFDSVVLFAVALNTLALEASPAYEGNTDTLSIRTDNPQEIVELLEDNGIFHFKVDGLDGRDEEHDQFRTDAEADADALASAGMGTDEDYGCFDGGCGDE